MRLHLLPSLAVMALLATAHTAHAQKGLTFTEINPAVNAPFNLKAIANDGTVVADVRNPSTSNWSTYTLRKGQLSSFAAVPNAVSLYTGDINNFGVIVGGFRDSLNRNRGFIRAANGTITLYDAPGALFTRLFSVTDSGAFMGMYVDSDENVKNFIVDGGVFSDVSAPGPAGILWFTMNSAGDLAGTVSDEEGNGKAYISQGGTFQEIVVPNSLATQPTVINDRGEVAGTFRADVPNGFSDQSGFGFIWNHGVVQVVNYRPKWPTTKTFQFGPQTVTGTFVDQVECRVVGMNDKRQVLVELSGIYVFGGQNFILDIRRFQGSVG